ncbi:MAG: bifunctional lysylphosphatidylglycerol flippase/synthetase MprF [Pirellulales bacterium]|nr:bifunctional lysylphosphatidylglycerol flippase/synthetase MprF [Pirellulales bacterium]
MLALVRRYHSLIAAVGMLVAFSVAAWLLYGELKHYHYSDIRQSLDAIPTRRIAEAVFLVVLNYVVLVGYDLLALVYIGRKLPLARVAMVSFVGFVSSYNFGAALGGTSVRFRLYSLWGLSAVEIMKLLVGLALAYWPGLFAAAGIVFVWQPFDIPDRFQFGFDNVRPVGWILLGSLAMYLLLTVLRSRPFIVRGLELALPSPGLAIAQTSVAALDLFIAAGILYTLFPDDVPVNYLQFVGIFLLAAVVVIFSHVPGGLGVFELVILTLTAPQHPGEVLGALLIYRVIYFLLPLALAALLMGANELRARSGDLARLATTVREKTPVVPPLVFVFATVAAGAVLVFSGSTPLDPSRIDLVRRWLPLSVIETSHFLGSVVGTVLLLLARGLQRRLDAAYWLTLGALALGIVLVVLKGFDFEEAVILAVIFVAMLPARRQFYRHGSLFRQPLTSRWIALVLLVLGTALWLGMFNYKHVEFRDELWWQFTLHGSASRFLRASVGVVGVLLSFGVMRLVRPAPPPPHDTDAATLDRVAPLVARSDRTSAGLALVGDKRILFADDDAGFLMFGIHGRSWVALGDPFGPADVQDELAWRFRELCDRYDGWTVFYEIGEENLGRYIDLGLALMKIGEEARVPLGTFSLEGGARRGLRHTHHKFEKLGVQFEVVPQAEVAALLPELRAISEAWLAEKNTREKSFSLGYFDDDYVRRCPASIVRHEGKIVAFANLFCGAPGSELSLDLMRYLPEAPEGVMEYLFIELMLWGRAQGFAWFNLGMAPLAGLEDHALSTWWNRTGSLLFRHGEHFYNFQGLRAYKDKFDPEWRAKYMASPAGMALPLILTDVASLISGGVTGLVTK